MQVADDVGCSEEGEDQWVVYRDSPKHEGPSVGYASADSAAASTPKSDLDVIRQRLISAVQRPHQPSSAAGIITGSPAGRRATPSTDALALRFPHHGPLNKLDDDIELEFR